MKFLLEWVSCYGAGARTSESSSSEVKNHPPYVAEDAGLMSRPRKRGRLGSRSGSSSSEWKPSLCAISEEGVGVTERGGGRGGGGERRVERDRALAAAAAEAEAESVAVTKKKTSRARVHDRRYRDDYGRASIQTVIPAFSPTPFVF